MCDEMFLKNLEILKTTHTSTVGYAKLPVPFIDMHTLDRSSMTSPSGFCTAKMKPIVGGIY